MAENRAAHNSQGNGSKEDLARVPVLHVYVHHTRVFNAWPFLMIFVNMVFLADPLKA